MIYEIEHCNYYKVSYLLKNVKNFPEVRAVINNNNPGKIYVDDEENPKTALVWNQGMQGFYFIGDEYNDNFLRSINKYINEKIINELIDIGINWFEISGINDRWNERIEEVFGDKGVQYGCQLVYVLNKNRFLYDKDLINGYNIRKLDKDVFETEISNLDFLKNELELFWGSINNFFDKGICYYAVEDNKIVSMCYSGFKADKIETIGIKTLKEYRRKRFAFTLASKFIEDCFKRHIIPYWDCSEDNIGSKMLAEKLGFEKSNEYRCYWFNF